MATTCRNVLTWIQNFLRKLMIFAYLFLVVWSFSKVPYYFGFDRNGETTYEKGGLTQSINLVFWVDGYQTIKLQNPACNFILVHMILGATLCVMASLSFINSGWRKKYGWLFFAFSLIFGLHNIPAGITMRQSIFKYLLNFSVYLVIVSALWGFYTLKNYDNNPTKAEKYLLFQYSAILFCNSGAIIEFKGVISKFFYRINTGSFEDYGNTPNPFTGKSVYDLIPESFGLGFFLIFFAIVWIWLPVQILQVRTDKTKTSTEEKNEGEPLLSR